MGLPGLVNRGVRVLATAVVPKPDRLVVSAQELGGGARGVRELGLVGLAGLGTLLLTSDRSSCKAFM